MPGLFPATSTWSHIYSQPPDTSYSRFISHRLPEEASGGLAEGECAQGEDSAAANTHGANHGAAGGRQKGYRGRDCCARFPRGGDDQLAAAPPR